MHEMLFANISSEKRQQIKCKKKLHADFQQTGHISKWPFGQKTVSLGVNVSLL